MVKFLRYHVVAVCLCVLLYMMSCSAVFALEQDEARVSVAWSTQTPYLGSAPTVTVLFINDGSEPLTISYFGLHFDWMTEDRFLGYDLSADPVIVPANDAEFFSEVTITIPENVSIGMHTYYVGVDGIEGASTEFSWDSSTLSLMVQNSAQQLYSELETQVSNGITEAKDANYQSPEAQSFLAHAETQYSLATSNADEQNWDDAISQLQAASLYLDQAASNEETYVPSGNDLLDLLVILVGVVLVAVVAVFVIVVLTRKRNPSAQENPPV
jgi:hypothetical protein